jgi:biotin-(acetyl-CoA carboxylase) ligase
MLGKTVTISTQNGKITGKAINLDEDGSLIIKQGPEQIKITTGDVVYRK